MLISLNAIKKYVDINIPTEDLIKLIGSRLVEVEGSVDLSPKYDNIYIVKVVECELIPETHLHLCQIDVGKSIFPDRSEAAAVRPLGRVRKAQKERVAPVKTGCDDACPEKGFPTSKNLVQVVCGAPNVHQGMLAVWIAPGAIVPKTYNNENFKMGTRKLRGYESNGMLAGIDELDLGDDDSGIVEINPKDAKPGDKFADIFDLNDVILDIENKSLTHRPDCFGLIGFAREIAGILGQKFNEPEIFSDPDFATKRLKNILSSTAHSVSIEISDPEICPAYGAAVINIEQVPKPTKYLTKDAVFLAKAGMRTIDPIVDLTNIIMLETGQPLHAFDYDKFIAVGHSEKPKVVIRVAKDGEELQLLDGKTIKCTKNDILVTSNNHPVALAGAMGGLNTAVDASTKRIVLESATFSLYNLRKTQMAHGIFSEAITRFTKGQPASITYPVLAETAARLGKNIEGIAYENAMAICDARQGKKSDNVVKITTEEINSLLGTTYSTDLIVRTLENVGFQISSEKDHPPVQSVRKEKSLSIVPPLWRTDIHIKEDIIEEVGRLLGYDNIPLDFPTRNFVGAEPNSSLALKTKIRQILSDKLATHEVLTYSFISKKLLEKVGEDPENSYEIVNSISPELQCFRQSITPSILDKIRENQKAGHENFTLYEINQVSQKSAGLTPEHTPITTNHLSIVTLGDYYKIKSIFEYLGHELGITFEIREFTDKAMPYFEPSHSVDVYLDDQKIGSFGEIRASVLRQFKLQPTVSAFELDLDLLGEKSQKYTKTSKFSSYNSSKFPAVGRDITFKASEHTTFASILSSITDVLKKQDLVFSVEPTFIYQPKLARTKNYSFHLKFASQNHTLQSDEISAIIDEVIKITKQTLGVEVV